MVGQSPSIQSFFPLRSSSPSKPQRSSSPVYGDGFTNEELETVLNPVQQDNWSPPGDYEDAEIGSLMPGPKRVTFCGRIANLMDSSPTSRLPSAAKGSFHVVVKDNTGAITVRLSYANMNYNLQLGQFVTVWATHISNGDRGMFSCTAAPLFVSIFPERDKSCRFRVRQDIGSDDLCRVPLKHESGLMSLKNFVNGGSEVSNAKILVVVKSIGARKKVTTKIGASADLVSVGVFDETEEATLSLWGTKSVSATDWKPSSTVLLLSSPGLNASRKNWLSLTSDTFVDVDPQMVEATYLRKLAERMTKRDHVNPAFPQIDYEAWNLTKPNERVLYTLADVDDRAREAPGEHFEGYLSVIITELNMVALRRQNMLLSSECCGIPMYSNSELKKCKHCEQEMRLKVNPRVVGRLIDESGCIASGKLVLTDKAWVQLLGRSVEEVVRSDTGTLKSIEQRMLFVRVTLMFWWNEEVGKLAVVEVSE